MPAQKLCGNDRWWIPAQKLCGNDMVVEPAFKRRLFFVSIRRVSGGVTETTRKPLRNQEPSRNLIALAKEPSIRYRVEQMHGPGCEMTGNAR